MKLKLELVSLNHALDTITKLAAPPSGNITFTASKGKLRVSSAAELSQATVLVPAEVSKDGEFAVPLQAIRDAVRGRETLTLDFSNAVLTISSGKYKAALSTVDVLPMEPAPEDKTQEWSVTAEQASWLRGALKAVALKATAQTSTWIPAGVKLTPKSAFVACYDPQHMAWISSKEITGDLEVVLPMDVMQNVVEAFYRDKFTISLSKAFVIVRSKLAKVILALPVGDDSLPLSTVQEKVKEVTKAEGKGVKFMKADLAAFLDNAKAVVAKERAEIEFACGKGIDLAIKTVNGELKAHIEGSGKITFRIDLEYLQELMSKAGDEVELNVVGQAFLSAKLTQGYGVVGLNR